jgi:hypothetical protein
MERRRKIPSALDSLRQSIKAADVEVKQKNFCADTTYKTSERQRTVSRT